MHDSHFGPSHRRTIRNGNGNWSCDYHDDVSHLLDFGGGNTETVADLALAFFCTWARDFDYNRSVISIRTGRLFTKQQKVRRRRSVVPYHY